MKIRQPSAVRPCRSRLSAQSTEQHGTPKSLNVERKQNRSACCEVFRPLHSVEYRYKAGEAIARIHRQTFMLTAVVLSATAVYSLIGWNADRLRGFGNPVGSHRPGRGTARTYEIAVMAERSQVEWPDRVVGDA